MVNNEPEDEGSFVRGQITNHRCNLPRLTKAANWLGVSGVLRGVFSFVLVKFLQVALDKDGVSTVPGRCVDAQGLWGNRRQAAVSWR